MIERTMNVVKASRMKRLTQIAVCGGLSLIASQHQTIFAQTTSSDPPQWRSRSEMRDAEYQRLADRSSDRNIEFSTNAGRASLGRPTNVSEMPSSDSRSSVIPIATNSLSSVPTTGSQSRYREVPNSPWERSPQNLDPNRPNSTVDSYASNLSAHHSASATGNRNGNMIRQPAASVERTYVQEGFGQGDSQTAPSNTPSRSPAARGLPDRRDFQQPSDTPGHGSEMTMELSAYEKPTVKGFINQPRSQVPGSDRTTAQRLPYGGVAISNELATSGVGLGYPEPVRSSGPAGYNPTSFDSSSYDSSGYGAGNAPSHRNKQSVASPQPTNALPSSAPLSTPRSIPNSISREAMRDLPVTDEALQKAAQINDRSQNRDSIRTRYAQQHSMDQALFNPEPRNPSLLGSSESQPFESASTARSTVVGVIGGGDLRIRE